MGEVIVNGKVYPMWNQFIERKKEWIGGILEDTEYGSVTTTIGKVYESWQIESTYLSDSKKVNR